MTKHLMLAAAAAATFAAAPALAQAVYTGGTGTFTNLGDDGRNSGFDEVDLSSLTGVYTGNGTYTLNGVTFTSGLNSNVATTSSGVLTGLTGTFGGNAFTYGVNYTIQIDNVDTITLGGNTIDVFGTPVYLNPLTLTTGNVATGVLSARVGPAVPEPATWLMMILGFGMVGFGLRYRRESRTAKVSFG